MANLYPYSAPTMLWSALRMDNSCVYSSTFQSLERPWSWRAIPWATRVPWRFSNLDCYGDSWQRARMFHFGLIAAAIAIIALAAFKICFYKKKNILTG